MQFEWDDKKAQTNERKHGINFDEAKSCFYDPEKLRFMILPTLRMKTGKYYSSASGHLNWLRHLRFNLKIQSP